MSTLLVQSCSSSKKSVSEPVPAFDLYSGYYYKIIKKARREGEYDDDIDICILSAEYGLLDPEEKIVTYDKKMTASRADELNTDVVHELSRTIEKNDYSKVVINMGELYRRAIDGIESKTDAEVIMLEGGLGERGHVLKKFVRDKRVIKA
ncbi:DUF6884 domain-containing protein [Halorutilales archaeon Cl-col2-1]